MAYEMEPLTIEGVVKRKRLKRRGQAGVGEHQEDSLYSGEPLMKSSDAGDMGTSKMGLESQSSVDTTIATPIPGVDLGDTASTTLMASGNPKAMAAGAGLAVLMAESKRRTAEYETRQKLKQQRLERQQSAINKMISVSQGLKDL